VTPILSYDKYKGDLIGSVERGGEIKYFLEKEGFRKIFFGEEDEKKYKESSKIHNYIILDDDTDMLYDQRNHFIHVPQPPYHYDGFNEKFYKLSLKIINRSITEM
jgi:hypothetical protein